MSGRLARLVGNLESALTRLDAALARPRDEFMRDSAIQRFEFTFELFWKTLKAVGDDAGLTSYSPRDALREGFRLGVIDEDPGWFRMLEDRNVASHTYDERRADAIYSRLEQHARMMRAALGRIRERVPAAGT